MTTAPIWQRLGPLTRGFQAYGSAQKKRPYVTQVISVLFIFGTADVAAQAIGGKEYDAKKTVRTLFVGGLFAIPQYKW